ncbi:HDOD domain-containing protein [Pseudomonas turukhanskensis]|uniref:Response regulator n=1 Tax=Pseudomonas turukhanskensis TaxID=1806536 RepID=A0A9W6K3J6_9PSED|nr:HDOD domain-containing protein [Pseudomonas turukhanskensis]GLK87359.1 response regulator [Pseudomonas turukhanskensis]
MTKDFKAAPRIVIAAQDPWTRALLGQLLGNVRCDAQLLQFADGSSALEACRKRLPDLVIAEWALPGLNGLDFLGEIRRLQRKPPLPFILMTDRTDSASVREVLPLAPTMYLVHPFNMDKLQQRLRDLLLAPGQEVFCELPSLAPEQSLDAFLEGRRNLSDGAPLLDEVKDALSLALDPNELDLDVLEQRFIRDPQINARLIAAANSAAQHMGRPCQTLGQALPRLGVAHSINLVMGMALQRSTSLEDPRLAEQAAHFWGLSQRTADYARQLAEEQGIDAERCYCAGLLHSIGDLALLRCLQNWLLASGTLEDEAIVKALRKFGAGFGSALRARWRLPLELRELIAATYLLTGVYGRESLVMNLAAQMARWPDEQPLKDLAASKAAQQLNVNERKLQSMMPARVVAAPEPVGETQTS